MPSPPVTFANRVAALYWGFAAIYIVMTALMTWMILRDGRVDGVSPTITLIILALFWLGSVPLLAFVTRQACETVSIGSDGMVSVTRRYLLRVDQVRHPRTRVSDAHVAETTDSDGDAYFRAEVRLPDGSAVCLAESQVREGVDAAAARFNAAIGRSNTQQPD